MTGKMNSMVNIKKKRTKTNNCTYFDDSTYKSKKRHTFIGVKLRIIQTHKYIEE